MEALYTKDDLEKIRDIKMGRPPKKDNAPKKAAPEPAKPPAPKSKGRNDGKRKGRLFLKSFLADMGKPATEAQKKQALRDLEEIGKLLDDPGYIKDKPMALAVCTMLIKLSLMTGMAIDSIGHKLWLRLYDYIGRTE